MTALQAAAIFSTSFVAAPLALAAPPPDDPTGEWMVEKGYATIRIIDCAGQYWGVVAWEKTPGNTDKNNPDPKLRSRPTLGMPILLGMKPAKPNEWSGDIYNSQDGRTYSASISMLRPDTLKVKGCVLGFLCGGENWTRVAPENSNSKPPAASTGSKTPSNVPAPTNGTKAPTTVPAPKQSANGNKPAATRSGTTPATEAQAAADDVCLGLVGLPGGAHERRLK